MTANSPHHIGYVVADIPAAVDRWVQTFGAGPFFWLGRHIAFEDLLHDGSPCTFDHSSAIGAWGDLFVELSEMHELGPTAVADALGGSERLGHVAYLSPDPAAESARLQELGLPHILYASQGPIAIRVHAAPHLGHAIEIHQVSEALDGLFAFIAGAADGWDGTDALREMPS